MTPSQQCKSYGLKSLEQVSKALGTKEDDKPVVSVQTLINWHKNKPELFKAVLLGVYCQTETESKQ